MASNTLAYRSFRELILQRETQRIRFSEDYERPERGLI
jgi:hypothetical protein